MARNNQRRTKTAPAPESPEDSRPPAASVLDFITPTEFVDLPSGGRFYGEDHPFYNQETVEIRYMTAKDEDILTNQTLLRKGLALERLLESTLSNNNVDPSTLLIGDRNAIIIAARSTGYGPRYQTSVNCPNCGEKIDYNFNLEEAEVYRGDSHGDKEITETDNGTFLVELPLTKVNVEMRLLTGKDETDANTASRQKKNSILENALTSQLRRVVVALNEETDVEIINKFVELMPAYDSRFLREAHAAVTPDVDMSQRFECSSCEHEQKMEVPFTVDFFWPNR